jgi:hypothetical protein
VQIAAVLEHRQRRSRVCLGIGWACLNRLLPIAQRFVAFTVALFIISLFAVLRMEFKGRLCLDAGQRRLQLGVLRIDGNGDLVRGDCTGDVPCGERLLCKSNLFGDFAFSLL